MLLQVVALTEFMPNITLVSTPVRQAITSTILRPQEQVPEELSIRVGLLIPLQEINISIITTAICLAIKAVLEHIHQIPLIKLRISDPQIVQVPKAKIMHHGAEII